jgi:hypothetical protein
MNAAISFILLGALLASSTQTPTKEIVPPATPDAHRLMTGQFLYQDSSNGKELGTSSIRIEKDATTGNYRFSVETNGFADQQWEAVATPSFVPLSARLSFGKAPNRLPYFDIAYASGKVTGSLATRTHSVLGPSHPVDAVISPGTVDQRIDWATVLASDLQPGRQFQFSVYDPAIGSSSVLATVGPLEEVRVPAGAFQIFRITSRVQKATGAEQYVVFATKTLPRVMVREDFPDGTITELAAKKII